MEFDHWNLFGIWCFPKVQVHILAGEDIGIFEDSGKIGFLSMDKGIVPPLVLNGRGGCGSVVMTGEDHRLSR